MASKKKASTKAAVLAAGPHPRPALQRSRDTVLTRSKEAPRRKDLTAALSFETKDLILQKIVPLVGATMANLMFLAPLSAVNEVASSGSIGELNPIPMVAIVGNTMAWLGYSMTNGDPFVVLANGPGLLLGLHYVLSLLPAAGSAELALKLVIITEDEARIAAPPCAAGSCGCSPSPAPRWRAHGRPRHRARSGRGRSRAPCRR